MMQLEDLYGAKLFGRRKNLTAYELYTNSADHPKQRLDNGLLDFAFLLEPTDSER